MTREYDIAWTKYMMESKPLNSPLISWEFYKIPVVEETVFNEIKKNWHTNVDFFKKAKKEKKVIIVTDNSFRIIFASKGICELNEYTMSEIIGKSPSIFQGKNTSEEVKKSIKQAIKSFKPFKEVILNYKKSGETYLCEIDATPIFDKDGVFLNYIALERMVS